ncbi:MAG: response regulator [Noviherbaspirillum sp.]
MTSHPAIDIPVKPRVLIADDSRIVRATLIKHIEGMFEFREALDGEQAWETLLIDPAIRVVITDLTMPKLDGYGLLRRIRASKISRIREIPVVVVSGSDEREERERAKAAGATDLITKGMDTAQLLSRLDILSKLVGTQREFERSLDSLVQHASGGVFMQLSSAETLNAQAEVLLAGATRNKRNFVILHVCVGLRHAGLEGVAPLPPAGVVVEAIGQLLLRTVRQTDHVAKTGDAEFTLVTSNINFDSARCFAQRICKAVANADLVKDSHISFVASCGLFSLNDEGIDAPGLTSADMRILARRRAQLGLSRTVTGVVGKDDELAFERGEDVVSIGSDWHGDAGHTPDLTLLLQWIREGRQSEVLPHIGKLSAELQPLVDLMSQQQKR